MDRRPAVSVAICLLNSSRFIAGTLDSVFAQTFADYEIILVDDGSTDGCVALVERRYPDRRIRIIRQEHRGLSHARRLSIAAASGEFVAFLDHDDIWLPHKLERQMAAASADPAAALFFSDCVYVDEQGRPLHRLSDEYELKDLDLSGTRAYAELLRRGCFVWQSTVLARTAALRAVDAFDPAYPYIADYDTWLRMARRYPLHYTPEVLAHWRVHAAQFTHRCPEITLADHRKLLGALYRTASNPRPIRIALGDRLLGQHRVSCVWLLKQQRVTLAARAAIGMFSYPDRLFAYGVGKILERPRLGPVVRRAVRAFRGVGRRVVAPMVNRREDSAGAPALTHIWMDGTALAAAQTGYFNLVAELIRTLAADAANIVHVVTPDAGRDALKDRLGEHAGRLEFHRTGGGSALTTPRGRPPHPNTIEVVVWRGAFRWAASRHVAIVQDLTTRIVPELHTAQNVAEFDRFLGYVVRHAAAIATVSEHSRRDIIERLPVFPDSVSVIPMPVHPVHRAPSFEPAVPAAHGIAQPYILCVGCIEPRKNLRRVVRAFDLIKDDAAAARHVLVLAGPQGWDHDFDRFLIESDAAPRVRRIGFVPLEHLPSLYRFASAIVCASVYEGFGIPVLEGMCASGIVLASGTTALREVLGDGITFDPYRTESIAAAMLHALSMTPDEAARYRRRCRARAEVLLRRLETDPLLPGLRPAARTVPA
jgi:glycosyltransferase involved in cell wall biosynthesis